ncbi:MAG: DUF4430 domain-containing protein [Clostridiales bacterium]|nr:DUF4430 domain-containing protein [Clostridiales bacterium]
MRKVIPAFKSILSLACLVVLLAAMALSFSSCSQSEKAPSGAESQSEQAVGQGAVKFTFKVTAGDSTSTFIVSTDETIVGNALLSNALIEGVTGEFGLYVVKVNGIVADYEKDGVYWAFYIDGEYAMTGVDATEIKEGSVYEFKQEKA